MSGRVCAYFLKGKCSFGNKCWNIHQNPAENNSNATSQSSSSGGSNIPNVNNATIGTIISTVSRDMREWNDAKNMWIFSCYAYASGLPSLTVGFRDISPEELRFESYKALSVDWNSYEKEFSNMLSQQTEMRRQLSNPTAEVRQKLDVVLKQLNARLSNNGNASSSNLGNTEFGQQGSDLSRGSKSVFGTNLQPSNNSGKLDAFGGSSNSVFGGSKSSSVFGNSFSSSNVFGGTANNAVGSSVQNSNVFGNVFGGRNDNFTNGQSFPSNTNSVNAFPANPFQANSANVFRNGSTGAPSSSVFGSANMLPQKFGADRMTQGENFGSSSAGIVNKQTNLTFPSSSGPISNPFFTQNSLSGSSTNFSSFPQGHNVSDSSSPFYNLYSKIDVLSENDLIAYGSDIFNLDNVPSLPPPVEFCS